MQESDEIYLKKNDRNRPQVLQGVRLHEGRVGLTRPDSHGLVLTVEVLGHHPLQHEGHSGAAGVRMHGQKASGLDGHFTHAQATSSVQREPGRQLDSSELLAMDANTLGRQLLCLLVFFHGGLLRHFGRGFRCLLQWEKSIDAASGGPIPCGLNCDRNRE